MFNDAIEIYDKSVSVWQILKNNKMNMSLLNFMTWFSKTCRKIKRLTTKIIKKKIFKMTFKVSKAISNQNSIFQLEIILFFLNFNISQLRIMLSSLIQNEFFIFQLNISEQINVSISIHFSLQKQNSVQSQYISQYQIQQFIFQQSIFTIFIVQRQQSQINLFDEKILNVKTDANCHIRFLNFLKKMTKTFRIKCTI